jgi:CheY-like chemotaxis protein
MSESQTILILDDGRCLVDRIGPALQRAGCTVLHFEDGEDAWAHALKTRVDVFVIDAELPYSDDGIYFIDNIRAKSFYAQTPIYGLFSEPMDPQRPSAHYRSYFRSGITTSFVKDTGMEALLQAILKAAAGREDDVNASAAPTRPAGSARHWQAVLDWLDQAGQPDLWI